MTTKIRVNGMSCSNCVRHVTEALQDLPGVKDVKIDLSTGEVTFEKPDSVTLNQVESAIDEAGYQMVK